MNGISVRTQAPSGLQRARDRVHGIDAKEIAWQIEVIRENTNSTAKPAATAAKAATPPRQKTPFTAEAGRIAVELSRLALRRGPGAAWIGLDWLGDAEAFQLICLGPDLYNGESGIALFLAAHAAATGTAASRELALAGIANLRKSLEKPQRAAHGPRPRPRRRHRPRLDCLCLHRAVETACDDDGLLADAHAIAALITDEVIAADKQLDVIGGSAGAILCLLRLYRDTQSNDALRRAVKCGEHLMAQSRIGPQGRRSWVGQGFGTRPLNGMSHGAAGFAYALASLAKATGREDFALAAEECVAFEDSKLQCRAP